MDAMRDALQLQIAGHLSQSAHARHALVSAVDPASHSVKVSVQPEGIVSGWIPDPGLACGTMRISCPAEVGTQVLVVPTEGDAEHPVIVARVFDVSTLPPTSPATGKPVQAGEIGIFLSDGTYLHVSPGRIAMKATLQVDGPITATGEITAGSIGLQQHVHGGVEAGTAISGASEATR